jgi:hypothetical protein
MDGGRISLTLLQNIRKRNMSPKIYIDFLSKKQMEKLNTKRLLAYKNIKEILATREHVEK